MDSEQIIHFWKMVAFDHLLFLQNSLEKKLQPKLDCLIETWYQIKNSPSLLSLGKELRDFLVVILQRQTTSHIEIRWTPTFINSLILLWDKGLTTLQNLSERISFPQLILDEHIFWLHQIEIQLDTLNSLLDRTAFEAKEQIIEKEHKISQLRRQATNIIKTFDLVSLHRLNNIVTGEVMMLVEFFKELYNLLVRKIILGAIPANLFDYFIRLQEYYLDNVCNL